MVKKNMTNDIQIIEHKKMDLSNCMLAVSFPTVGLVSSIAAHHIVDSLKLKEIGAIVSNKFMPTTIIHNNILPLQFEFTQEKRNVDQKMAVIKLQ